MVDETTINDYSTDAPRFLVTEEGDQTIIRDYATSAPRFRLNGKIASGGVEVMTTEERTAITPAEGELIWDTDLGVLYVGDGITPGGVTVGGGGGEGIIAGYRLSFDSDVLNVDRYMPIETVTGTTVTLQAGHAYKVYATTFAVTLNTETIPENSFGLEGHIEIYVGSTGFVVAGANVVLATPLEPASVNNCTVRFHDGFAIISVEDHIAGYIVTINATSGVNTLNYALSSASQGYVTFTASLNGQTLDMAGAATNGEKHIVGNGYTETAITGAVNCGTSKFTVANLSLQDVVVNGGTMTLGDAWIPSGSTVAVSGGGLAVEKVSGNGGVIDLGQTYIVGGGSASGVTITGGSNATSGGAFLLFRKNLSLTGCVLSGNVASRGGALSITSSTVDLVNTVVSGNIASAAGNDVQIKSFATLNINGGCVVDEIAIQTVPTDSSVIRFSGSNSVGRIYPSNVGSGCTVTLASGAIVDLTGNTNATPIAPGGGITFEPGGATVYPSAGQASAYMLGGMTVPTIGNTNVVNLNSSNVVISSGGTAYASGCTITGGGGGTTLNGGAFHVSRGATLNLNSVDLTGNGGNQGGAFYIVGTVKMSSSIVSGNTPSNVGKGAFVLTELDMTDCSFADQIFLRGGTASVIMRGSNTFGGYFAYDSGGGAVAFASGAILNLTGNTNATPINPGGGVIVNGSCQVITSAGTTVSIAGGTYTKINNDGTTN